MDICRIIDSTVDTWGEVHPETDFSAMGVMLRLNALTHGLNRSLAEMADTCGITMGEFDVLATLRRHGPGALLTPSFIAEVALVSPSGLTHRLTQLEKAGHIVRHSDPTDRRSFLIAITPSGEDLADRVVAFVAETSSMLLETISASRVRPFVRDVEALVGALKSVGTSVAAV